MLLPLISWPVFSVTSYRMLSGLSKQGICPNTIFDVGANVGQFAVAGAKIFPKATVYSFEPQPESIDRLKANTKNTENIVVFPLALGDQKGEVSFFVNTHSHSSSILRLGEAHSQSFPEAQESSEIRVQVDTLDSVLSDVHIAAPSLLKIDVQGYEIHVLQGAKTILRQIDYVILETSFKSLYRDEPVFDEMIETMQGYGFSFVRPIGWLSDPQTQEVLQMDALFVKRSMF